MIISVLGSAAGGGFPQWNCNCTNCQGFRQKNITAKARSQSSIAVSENGTDWVLLNASPDIRQQLQFFQAAYPQQIRGSGIKSIILMDSQLDHTTGLLSLREGCPLQVWCTHMVHDDLSTGFPVFEILKHWNGGLQWHEIITGQPFQIGCAPGLEFFPVAIPSAAPPYSPHRHDPHIGDNIALIIRDRHTARQLFYAPGLGQVTPEILAIMQTSDCVMVDGTLWQDDEMQQCGVGSKTGTEMGHLHIAGENGMLAYLDQLTQARKILIHINNTNPILNEDSAEAQILQQHQVEVAFDGMQIEL